MDLQVFATVVGSVGFPIIAIYFVWQKMDKNSQDYIKLLKEQMQDNNDTVEYTITFNLEKNDDGNWQILELSQEDLEKIHGIYNYDQA